MKQLCVNRQVCVGCCRCVDFAPCIFNMEGGLAFVQKQPQEQELAYANTAIENCPTEAIFWEEEK